MILLNSISIKKNIQFHHERCQILAWQVKRTDQLAAYLTPKLASISHGKTVKRIIWYEVLYIKLSMFSAGFDAYKLMWSVASNKNRLLKPDWNDKKSK